MNALGARKEANKEKKTALNLQLMGQTEIDISDVEHKMDKKEWYTRYDSALDDYICGLESALKENDEGKANELWDKIAETYSTIAGFGENDQTLAEKAGKMEDICTGDLPR